MVKVTLEKRVEMLEETMGGGDGVTARLGRVEARLGHVEARLGHIETEVREFRGEFLQFRDETRGEFSAVRGEMAAGFASVRAETATEFAKVRAELATKQDLAETRSQMRVLHEEVIGRLALIQEGQDAGRTGARRPRTKR